jgi:hypothetical protein
MSKSQIRSKINRLEFRISVIVICLLFVICDLEFIHRNLTVFSPFKLEAAPRGAVEPGTLCAINCVAQGGRDTSKMTQH